MISNLSSSISSTWPQLLAFRLLLGIGLGINASTVSVYAAECAPAAIRGGLAVSWQMWTAFGIFLGFVANAAVYNVSTGARIVCAKLTQFLDSMARMRGGYNWPRRSYRQFHCSSCCTFALSLLRGTSSMANNTTGHSKTSASFVIVNYRPRRKSMPRTFSIE